MSPTGNNVNCRSPLCGIVMSKREDGWRRRVSYPAKKCWTEA